MKQIDRTDYAAIAREAFRNWASIQDHARFHGSGFITAGDVVISTTDVDLKLLHILPREVRSAFWYAVIEDRTGTEVAAMLGISDFTVSKRVNHASRLLAHHLFDVPMDELLNYTPPPKVQIDEQEQLRFYEPRTNTPRHLPRNDDYCGRGHELTEENTYVYEDDRYTDGLLKQCKLCRRLNYLSKREKKRQAKILADQTSTPPTRHFFSPA